MIEHVLVTVKKSDCEFHSYGRYTFSILPRAGEKVNVNGPMGALDIVEVVDVEHIPIVSEPHTAVAQWAKEERGPLVTLYVRLFSRH